MNIARINCVLDLTGRKTLFLVVLGVVAGLVLALTVPMQVH
jgi:hypothetical protein